ncbi:MAG: tetratricopeptide repeat protein [Verrucomicrobia bacterium]|nr:tetratricopeptide repeat protein [Verrucomicrobiota bacterium]
MKRSTQLGTLIAISLTLGSCYRVPKEIEPKINYVVQDRYLRQLPHPFPELSPAERQTQWGAEYLIGISMARNLDLYQAITAFRRAEILIPQEETARRLEISYEILLCYYLGQKYDEAAQSYQNSPLFKATPDFAAFHDLLIILYDIHQQLGECTQAAQILELIQQYYPDDYDTLALSSALQSADLPLLDHFAACPPERPYLREFLCNYDTQKKSPTTAAVLNAILPGAGYLYVGQRQTAATAFLVNGLFIASSVYFFIHGPIYAGIITTSFEAGWYFGGIYGAANEAKFYNERIYERLANPMMNCERLFPIFRLNYAF